MTSVIPEVEFRKINFEDSTYSFEVLAANEAYCFTLDIKLVMTSRGFIR